ncbi:T6SS phospholipase effector Tle1-like catalytic domain-containing protein [Rhizobium helianthi]|uniref:T6SS phospholipase effector Tle1-like catalytic domain-containing protein n=1 Tax=Rhizobium helianthi TaxID=1132695 RepID=A0ABW4M6X0_9HYPH
MAKNIVILFDGTSNEISADRTNILRLFGCLERSEHQVVYYDPGVGTFGSPNAWSKLQRQAAEVWGLATGWGLDQNVKEAYRMLVETYDAGPKAADGKHHDRDRIYIFGFSRGAYTARVLAGFIHAFGLTKKIHLNLLDYAYRTYKGIPDKEQMLQSDDVHGEAPSAFRSMRLYERTLRNDRPPIKLLGLFDTVASVIEPGKFGPQFKTHPFTHRNPSVEVVRHAVAIDEQRTMFQPELWAIDQPYWGGPFRPKEVHKQNVKEVWFAGVHGDVGGGYPEVESGQIKIPLCWMVNETRPTGLIYSERAIANLVMGEKGGKYVSPNQLAPLHDSMNTFWPIAEWLPRAIPKTSWRSGGKTGGWYIPRYDRRLIASDALIHESVKVRLQADAYSPANLPPDPNFTS